MVQVVGERSLELGGDKGMVGGQGRRGVGGGEAGRRSGGGGGEQEEGGGGKLL